MDTTLVMVTLLSMGMAGALSVIVWRMLRDEKRRADSRVAALVTLAAAEATERAADRASRVPEPRDAHVPATPRGGDAERTPRRAEAGPLFVQHREESRWGQRLVVMAALALIAASTILFTLAARDRTPRAAGAPPAPAARQASPVAAGGPAGLELISLRDTRQNGALTITGLVHNPRSGAALSRVTVTAYAFDDNGTFLASGRALLDVTSLVPDDESPFTVSVPVAGQVARYRIGFRDSDGRVIAHVDKRQQGPVAARW
jgi:hypothetical protein